MENWCWKVSLWLCKGILHDPISSEIEPSEPYFCRVIGEKAENNRGANGDLLYSLSRKS